MKHKESPDFMESPGFLCIGWLDYFPRYNGHGFDLPGMHMPGLVLGHLRHKPYFKMAADSMSIFFEGG